MESKKQKKKNELTETEQIGDCQRQGMEEMKEDGQKVQTSSYKINKFWGCNVQHDD